jgi:hypothetical protein
MKPVACGGSQETISPMAALHHARVRRLPESIGALRNLRYLGCLQTRTLEALPELRGEPVLR